MAHARDFQHLRCSKCTRSLAHLLAGQNVKISIKCQRCGHVTEFDVAVVVANAEKSITKKVRDSKRGGRDLGHRPDPAHSLRVAGN